MTFPYPLPELDLSAPLDQYRGIVRSDWVDLNKHMNMAYYLVAFDKASDVLLEQLGVAWAYTEHELGMVFVVEAHIHYERELCEGDPIRITSQILDRSAKLIHLYQSMYHGAEGFAAATSEALLMHVDYRSRRSSPWPDACVERLEALAAAHRALPTPDKRGRSIGINRLRAESKSN